MREFRYPHCVRCDCPLARLLNEGRYRVLCIRCHESMAANSNRNPNACRCGMVVTCKICRQREYRYASYQKNKEHYRAYYYEYYYRNWEAMRAKQIAWVKARKARKKALLETKNDV